MIRQTWASADGLSCSSCHPPTSFPEKELKKQNLSKHLPVVGGRPQLWFRARDDIIQLVLACIHLIKHQSMNSKFKTGFNLLQNPFMFFKMPERGPVLRLLLQKSLKRKFRLLFPCSINWAKLQVNLNKLPTFGGHIVVWRMQLCSNCVLNRYGHWIIKWSEQFILRVWVYLRVIEGILPKYDDVE